MNAMDEQLLRVLRTDNPWLTGAPLGPWIGRHLPAEWVPRRLRLSPGERVTLVIGPRQAGKSTLLWKHLEESGSPALHLNCEEPSVRDWLRSPALFLADLAELEIDVPAFFFEEIQALDEAGLFLKGLADRHTGRALYATGSSSFHLEAATRESLAGRADRHLLLALSVAEVADTLGGGRGLRRPDLTAAIERLLVYGGYPRVYTSPSPSEELAGLVEAFIVRDASDRFRIRHVAALRKILQLAASQIGNLCKMDEWASLAGVSGDTVADYCQILEDTHILRLVRPFVGGKRAEITRAPKAYFLDNGVRNQIFGGFHPWHDRTDRGALLENLVFGELSKRFNPLLDSIRYWRSKSGAEVDFVVEHRGRRLAFEVKAGDPRGKVSRGARSFIEAYEPETLVIVHLAKDGREADESREQIGETRVRTVALEDLDAWLGDLMENSSA